MTIRDILKTKFTESIAATFGQEYANFDPIIQAASQAQFGDYQANFALGLAKTLKKKPTEIAQAVIANFNHPAICERVEASGPGFINIYLAKDFLKKQLQAISEDSRLGTAKISSPKKVIVEYGSPNIAKEMHVGHLRSTIIGDAIARILDFLGYQVIRQNHIGDWGTQFGMLIQYMLETQWDSKKEHSISEVNSLYKQAKQRFDSDEAFANKARSQVVALQSGDPKTLAIWQQLVTESERHFQETYERLQVLLTKEDVRGESFYNPMLPNIVAELKAKSMATIDDEAVTVFLEGFVDRDNQPLPMIIQKSDGGYLYSTTDLAALKFRTTDLGAERIIYVVDARQAQHFAMLFAAAKKAGWTTDKLRLEHAAFGTILGKDRKPFKTRNGESIQLTALLDEAEKRAATIVASKEQFTAEQRDHIAKTVGIGALKYADLSTDKIKDYVFDWDRMLSFEGNTAPYLQNAYVRIQSIFRKGDINAAEISQFQLQITEPLEHLMAIRILEFPDIITMVAEELAPHRLCSYLHDLAANFHKFYESCPVLITNDPIQRQSRLLLCALTASTLRLGLDLLGIEVLEQM